MGWFSDVNAQGVRRVAAALDMQVADKRSSGIGPCPCCNAEKRHPRRHDRRLSIGVRPDDQGWRCHECDAHGDPVGLLAAVVTGSVRPDGWAGVRRRGAEVGLCDLDERDDRPFVQRRPRQPPPASAPVAERAPAAELAALWTACRPVLDDKVVANWLRFRGLDPATVEDRDLARALPRDAALPPWASGPGGDWRTSGRLCLFAMYDHDGRLMSLRARGVRDDINPKALAPAGFAVAGLVLADVLGRRLLAGDADAAQLVRRAGVIVAEGEPAFLAAAGVFSDADEFAPAVLGIVAGSWTDEIASRIPNDTRVTVDVDADPTGDKYAMAIADTLIDRCDVRDARQVAA